MTTLEITFDGGKKISTLINGQHIQTDQPVRAGGEGSAPSPFDLFLASLGTCAGIFIKSFCDQRQIPTDNIRLYQHMHFSQESHLFEKFELEIHIPADFPEKYKDSLIHVAESCSVKKHLMHPPEFEVYTRTV
jgi:ribosomal protein S12 methylthiotransferase accessory factor